jgi:hypothetical protein
MSGPRLADCLGVTGRLKIYKIFDYLLPLLRKSAAGHPVIYTASSHGQRLIRLDLYDGPVDTGVFNPREQSGCRTEIESWSAFARRRRDT